MTKPLSDYVNDTVTAMNNISLSAPAHPLDPLSLAEAGLARKIILDVRGLGVVVKFRSIFMHEPPKRDLVPFLELEHSKGISADTPRPAREAYVQYDVVSSDRTVQFTESIVDLASGKETMYRPIGKPHHSPLTT